jgi:hypothetical protein
VADEPLDCLPGAAALVAVTEVGPLVVVVMEPGVEVSLSTLSYRRLRIKGRSPVGWLLKEDETEGGAVAFLKEAIRAFPFRVHAWAHRPRLLLYGGRLRDGLSEPGRGASHGVPYTPRTNGMVGRFNGRVQREVLSITLRSHADLEIALQGFNRASIVLIQAKASSMRFLTRWLMP